MPEEKHKLSSLAQKGAFYRFVVSIILISVLPILALAYVALAENHLLQMGHTAFYVLLGSVFSLVILGYVLLCRYPINIARLHRSLDSMVKGRMSDQVRLLGDEHDIEGIQESVSGIIEQLKERIELIEREKEILERELQQASKLKVMGAMASGIAHEINTPVQFVSDNTRYVSKATQDLFGFVGSVKGAIDNWEAQRHQAVELVKELSMAQGTANLPLLETEVSSALKESEEGLARITAIVYAMREFAHMGQQEKVEANLNETIQSAVTISRNEWKYVSGLDLDLDPAIPSILCWPDDVTQVILNLIINAAHAIESTGIAKQGGKGKITISTRAEDAFVVISVADTGCGMPPEIRDKVFENFFTTKERGKGTGQGLAISHSLVVKKHKGSLTFETELNKGTTFFVRLPVNT